jgi:uncharacterized protein YbbK (DUF523 family)
MFEDKSIKLCRFCGEITNGVLCPRHKTKENRKEDILEQLKIEKERGGKVSDRLFMFDRNKLLKEYEIR